MRIEISVVIAPRQSLDLGNGEPFGVHDHAAVRATERDVYDSALPRHPHRQRAHLIKRDSSIVADATLGRPAIDVVLHTIAGEHLDVTVIHAHGKVDGQLTLWHAQRLADSRIQLKPLSRRLELFERHRIGIGATIAQRLTAH